MIEDENRELDGLVAEKVMGWKWATLNPTTYSILTGNRFLVRPDNQDPAYQECGTDLPLRNPWYSDAPFYSTDIAAAWSVEEKIKELGLERQYGNELGIVIAESGRTGLHVEPFDLIHASPVDRCRAALKAVS